MVVNDCTFWYVRTEDLEVLAVSIFRVEIRVRFLFETEYGGSTFLHAVGAYLPGYTTSQLRLLQLYTINFFIIKPTRCTNFTN